VTKPNPFLLEDVVPPKALAALRLASEALIRANVRHVVVGGLAVGAHGHPGASKVVELLVGAEAFVSHPNGLMTLRPEVPFRVNGVAIVLLSPEPDEGFLEEVLAQPPGSIMEAPPLVYMKLKASRLKDRSDVVELIKASIDVDACRGYLEVHALALVSGFDRLVATAAEEQG
jgi:hypothetical protein